MTALWAILRDSLRESVDKKALPVLLVLALLPIVTCLGIGFEQRTVEETVALQLEDFGRLSANRRGGSMTIGVGHTFALVPDGADDAAQALSDASEADGAREDDLHHFRITSDGPGDRSYGAWVLEFEREHSYWLLPVELRGERGRPGEDLPETIDGRSLDEWALERRFRAAGWDRVRVRTVPSDSGGSTFDVALAADDPEQVGAGQEITLFFGLTELPPGSTSIAAFVVRVQLLIANIFLGMLTILTALSACSAFVPDMLQKGTLDLLLARPIRRTGLLLGKYLGSLWFTALVGTFAIGGCHLALALGSGFHNPWFLLTVPVFLLNFAVLQSVSVLVGTWTRSAGLAFLAAFLVWFFADLVEGAYVLVNDPALIERMGLPFEIPRFVIQAVRVVYWTLPKTGAVAALADRAIAHDALDPATLRQIPEADLDEVLGAGDDALGLQVASTVAFAVVMLGLAVWSFRRRDY